MSRCKIDQHRARAFATTVEQNEQLETIHFGHSSLEEAALLRRIQRRPRSVARMRTDLMLHQMTSHRANSLGNLQTDHTANLDSIILNSDQSSVVYVSYGRRPNVIGSVRCSATTSLADARRSIEENFTLADENYVMMAQDGKRSFPRHEEDKRHVLLDCGSCLQLRPSSWISL